MANITGYFNGGAYQYKGNPFAGNNSDALGASYVSGIISASFASRTTGTSVTSGTSGSSGTSGVSGISASSGSSGVSGVSGYSYVSYGNVENLTIDEILNQLSNGKLTKDDMIKWLKANASDYTYTETNSLLTFKFTYKNQKYTVTCKITTQESQLDIIAANNRTELAINNNILGLTGHGTGIRGNFDTIIGGLRLIDIQIRQPKNFDKAIDTIQPITPAYDYISYSLDQLKKVLDDATIELYFEKSGSNYKIKSEFKNKFSTLKDVENYKNKVSTIQNQLVLQNFMNGLNRKQNGASALLYNNVTNSTMTVNNYEQVLGSTTLLSGNELANLKQNAVKRFVSEFSTGNLAYQQARLILDSIGVENLSMKLANDIYTISFTFNGQTYTTNCNKSAATKGNDNVVQQNFTEAYINTFVSQGASQSLIDSYFYKSSNGDGETTYSLKDGKNILAFQVELGLKTVISSSEVNSLNIGLEASVFNEIINQYFEQTNMNGNNVYVLKYGNLEQIKNVISETYVSLQIDSKPNFVPTNADPYGGFALTDNDTLEERKANYYYMCYMNGVPFTGDEFENGTFDKEIALACGVYPSGSEVFKEYMKDSEVRNYLSSNFGINVPDPSNTVAFTEFVTKNQELWQKLADLSAIDANGNYTGEYNKQNVLKYFGLALTDENVLNYAENLTYKSGNTSNTQIDVKLEDIENYIKSKYPNLVGNVLNSDNLTMITEMVGAYVLAANSTTQMQEVVSVAVELLQSAQAKGVDPAEYISARLVDFVEMRIETPGMPLDEMNTELAIGNVTDLLLDGINSTYSDIYGEVPDSIDSLLEMQDLGLVFSDTEPEGRSAYIGYRNIAYLRYAQDGDLTNQVFYDNIAGDLISIFPKQIYMTYEQLDELGAKIQKLSPEQIINFTNKILELPSTNDDAYQEKYDVFMAEFENAVSSSNYTISNQNGIVDINTVFKLTYGCEFNPDEIILADGKIEEMQDLQAEVILDSILESILNKYNDGTLSFGDALWQIGYVNTNSAVPSEIENFLKAFTGIDNLYVDGGTVIVDIPSASRGDGPRRASQSEGNVKEISIEDLIARQRGPLAGASDKLAEIGESLDNWITSHIPDNFFGDVVSFVYDGIKMDFEAWNYLRTHSSENQNPFYESIQYQQDLMKCLEKHRVEIANGSYTLDDAYAEVANENLSQSTYAIFAAIMPGATDKFVSKFVSPLFSKIATSTVGRTVGDWVTNVMATKVKSCAERIGTSTIALKFAEYAGNKSSSATSLTVKRNLRNIEKRILDIRYEKGLGGYYTQSVKESGIVDYMDQLPKLTRNHIKDYLELDKKGQLGRYCIGYRYMDAHNLRIAPYINDEIKRLREGFTSSVREFATGTSFEKALADTPIGEAFLHEGKLYFKAKEGACAELSLTKEMYDKLFPPLNRFIINQGGTSNRALEHLNPQSCWFLSASARKYIEPETRYEIVKLFSQVGDDVYVKLPSGNFTYKFSSGNVPDLKGLGYDDWFKLSNSSPWTNMLEHTASFVNQDFEHWISGRNFVDFSNGKTVDLKGWCVFEDAGGNVVLDVNKYVSNITHYLSELDSPISESTLKLFGQGEYLLTGIKAEVKDAQSVVQAMQNISQGRNISMGILFDEAHAATVTRVENNRIYFTDPLCTWAENYMSPELYNFMISHVSNPRIRNTAAVLTAFLAMGGATSVNAQTSQGTQGMGTTAAGSYQTTQRPDGGILLQGTIPNPMSGSSGNAFSGGSKGYNGSAAANVSIDAALQKMLDNLRSQGISTSGLNWSTDASGNIVYTVNIQNPSNNQAGNPVFPTVITDIGEYVNSQVQQSFLQTLHSLERWNRIDSQYYNYTFDQLLSDIQGDKFRGEDGKFDMDSFISFIRYTNPTLQVMTLPSIENSQGLDINEIYITRPDGTITKVSIARTSNGDYAIQAIDYNDYISYLGSQDPSQQKLAQEFLPYSFIEALKNSESELGINEAALNARINEIITNIQYKFGVESIAGALQLLNYYSKDGKFDGDSFNILINSCENLNDIIMLGNLLNGYAQLKKEEHSFDAINDLQAWLQNKQSWISGVLNYQGNLLVFNEYQALYNSFIDINGNAQSWESALYQMMALEAAAKRLGVSISTYLAMDPETRRQKEGMLTTPFDDTVLNFDLDSFRIKDQDDVTLPNQTSIIKAPNWFIAAYKNGGIQKSTDLFGVEYGNVQLTDEQGEKLDAEIEHFEYWRNLYISKTSGMSMTALYNLYQYDMMMFMLWTLFDLPALDVSKDLGWEALYNLYKEKTGGLNI